MAFNFLIVDVKDRIATITVNRPDKLNALNDATMTELGQAFQLVSDDSTVGGIIVTGAGRAFVAGADISELQGLSRGGAEHVARKGQKVFRSFETSSKPTIAAVNGFALGGGCELALSCHVRIASENAKFGQPEVKLGTIPGYGGTQRLPHIVGPGRALQLLMTGEIIDATEAYRIGLVNKVVPAAESVVDASRVMMGQMLANGPQALARIIDLVNTAVTPTSDKHGHNHVGQDREATLFGALAETKDMQEGTTAFLEKRAPKFGGT
jgi:enoyl-CoA hydratase